MHYKPPLQSATLLKRYKRFLADVRQEDGRIVTLHCPNTGAMTGCAESGSRVWYSLSDNPKRKYPGTWELAEQRSTQGHCWIGVNTLRANVLVTEGINSGLIESFQGYNKLRKEVRYGANSRIDVLLSDHTTQPDCYIEVKSVTLADEQGHGWFPDAVSVRGTKHLQELTKMIQQGHRAALVFCVQHTGIVQVSPAETIDPAYGAAFRQAIQVGLEVMAYQAEFSPTEAKLVRSLPVCY